MGYRAAMRAILLLAVLILAGALEVILLRRIVLHPASGWARAEEVLPFFLAAASVPLTWGVLLLLGASMARSVPSVAAPLLWTCVLGPLFAYLALAQYGHATPGLLLAGLVAQSVALFVASMRFFRLPGAVPRPASGSRE